MNEFIVGACEGCRTPLTHDKVRWRQFTGWKRGRDPYMREVTPTPVVRCADCPPGKAGAVSTQTSLF